MQQSPEEPNVVTEPNHVLNSINKLLTLPPSPEKDLQTRSFIETRLKQLQERSVKTVINTDSAVIDDFLNPETIIKPHSDVLGFRVDDMSIYTMLFHELQEFHDSPAWRDASSRRIVPYAVLRTVTHYYGGIPDDEDMVTQYKQMYEALELLRVELKAHNVDFDSISMEKLKEQEIAHCIERASTAHNLFQFLGMNASLVMGRDCQFPIGNKPIGHAYNIVHDEDGLFISDPTNPVNFYSEDEEPINNFPSVHPISHADFEAIKNKGQTAVTWQTEYVVTNGKAQPRREETWLYGG